MKRFILIFMIISTGLCLIAVDDRPFREDDMLTANMEEPIEDVQPNWATDSLNVSGVGRVPYFGEAYDVFIVDTLAYVCMGYNLVILNIKDKSKPILLGYIDTPYDARGVYVLGIYAYIANGDYGLRIINISNPLEPTYVGSYNTPGYALNVYVLDSYAYVADGYYGLRIINISNPLEPTYVGYYNTSGFAWDVYVSGSYAYVDDYDYGLRIINISNPASPIEIGYYNTPGHAKGFYVSDSYAYVADSYEGLRIIDITNPASPSEVGYYDTLWDASGVYVLGNYAYVTDSYEGLRIISISNPANPIEVGYYDTPGDADGIYVLDNYAYVADYDYGLRIIDISNPASPTEPGYYMIPGLVYGVYVLGNYAYVADCDFGLRIIDTSDPSNPIEVGYCDTPGYAYGVYVLDNYAYVADYAFGLRIIDISNPSNPIEVGYYDTPGYASNVYVSGSYAYVAVESGLSIINISNPSSPLEVGYYDTPGDAYGVYVVDNYAYVADGYYGLRIIDISNPASPIEVGYYDTPGDAQDVYVSGNYAYVADYAFGLRIINISNPTSPIEVGYYDTPGYAIDVHISNSYTYVADIRSVLILKPDFEMIPPDSFSLIYPIGNIKNNTPIYQWHKSYDEHFKDYKLYVNGILQLTVTDTTWTQPTAITDGQYVWYVLASDSSGNTTQSTETDTFRLDITKPTTPTLVSPINNSISNVSIFTWRKSTDNYSGIKRYELWYDDDSMFGSIDSFALSDTTYTTSLTEGKYYWKVRAIDNSDNIGDWSTRWSFEYDGTIPAIPNLVYPIQNEEVSDSIVLFDWDVVIKSISENQDVESNAIKATQIYYIINIDTTKTFSSPIFKDTVTIDSISFLINMGDKYYWRVKAYDEALNQGNWTSIDSFELDVTKPTIPDKICPLNGIANNDAIFIWHKATDNYSGIKGYSFWLDIDSLFSSPDTFLLSDTTYAPLLSEQEYYWKVRAIDNFDNIGDWSTRWSFEFDSTNPATPVLVSPINNSTTVSSIFTWNKSTDNYTGIKHYNLWFDNDSLFSSPDTVTTTDTSYTAALGDYTYYWMVRAIDNAENTGDWSDVWSFDFSPAGITDKFTLDTKEKRNTELTVTMNQVSYTTLANENAFSIYDITGKVVHSEMNNRTGKHSYNTEHLSSGIYFIRFKDGEKEINKKMVIIR
ncbi:MAG: T9SS type A sorting domain-containing protein [bacterium]|nr:T9SS type A sorting domain-containing protein [bacterium]